MEALGHGAAQVGQPAHLERAFDTLGHQGQAQRLTVAHHRARQLPAGVGITQLGHQRAGDLQDVDGQAAQVRQRGVAGAHIVDGDVHPGALQRVELGDAAVQVLEHRVLGDLEDQARWIDAGLAQDLADRVGEAAPGQAVSGDVHRDGQRRRAGVSVLPATHLLARLAQDQPLEALGEPVLRCGRQEVHGRDQPPGGMGPAHQRLSAQQLAGGQLDDRLVMQHQLVAGDRRRQLGSELAVRGRCGGLTVHRVATRSRLPRCVHRACRIAQQQRR